MLLGQVWVVDLRKDKAILRGLVRALPRQIPLKTWAAIVSNVLASGKELTGSLSKALESFRGEEMSLEGVTQSSVDTVLSISGALENLLNSMPRSKEETGKPLQLVVDAMFRNLGAGETHVYVERTDTVDKKNWGYVEDVCVSPLCI